MDDVLKSMVVPAELVRGERNYVVRLTTDDPGEDLRRGDYLIVAPREYAKDGELVIAAVDGEASVMRKYFREAGELVRLEGPAGSQIFPANRVGIHGVISGVIRKY